MLVTFDDPDLFFLLPDPPKMEYVLVVEKDKIKMWLVSE